MSPSAPIGLSSTVVAGLGLALVGLLLIARIAGRGAASAQPVLADEWLQALRPTWRQRLRFLPDALAWSSLAAVVIALSGPWRAERASVEGVDWVIAIDSSCSMQSDDVAPRRIDAARAALKTLVRRRPEDRFALVNFAGAAAAWAPLSRDAAYVFRLSDEIEIGQLPEGTALGDAVMESLLRLTHSEAGRPRAIVVISDGAHNAGRIAPSLAAQRAAKAGIPVFGISIGGAENPTAGAPSPRRARRPEPLAQIAHATGGRLFRATDADALLAHLNAARRQRTQPGRAPLGPRQDQTAIVAALALVLLVLGQALFAGPLRRLP